MIRIEKASAGSGKTYTLSHTYLSLLKERYAYRHILAVTFTNKATAEMKDRILRVLFHKSADDPDAKAMLTDILHDYSAFSVSTIDKFFQRALKAFAREIGQTADYKIELDKPSLINEAMDRILDSLSEEDTDVLGWLKTNMEYRLGRGERLSVEDELHEIGARLKNDEFTKLTASGETPDFSRERLLAVRENCEKIIREFHKDIYEAAKALVVKSKNAVKQAAVYQAGFKDTDRVPYPQVTLAKEADGTPFMDLFLSGNRFIWYNTARIILDSWFSLGLAREFFKSFDDLLREKDLMCLDDSNSLLQKIIADSDAPFVYEKLGVRYTNFLLDEFQDTSNVQWNNFLPLLAESDAGGNESLIVGDVKQSIYRWRDSDWELLAHRVKDSFPRADEHHSEFNWRSVDLVRDFNNKFFGKVKAILGKDSVLYGDVEQKFPEGKKTPDQQKGCVKVSFCDKNEEIEKVVESIGEALAAGASYSDITILVRMNKEGALIASELMSRGIRVISDDSLAISSSSVVRGLVAILSCLDNKKDKINDYLCSGLGVEIPEEYHSLLDLCEKILRAIKEKHPDSFKGESLFIQAFMDSLRDWVDANGNDLHFFLEYWNRKESYIGSPDNNDSVRILTVHKAKGLEAPYIIFPFIENVGMYRKGWHWCRLDTEGTPFGKECQGIYPVELNTSSADTLFRKDLEDEMQKQLIDNLNTVYVAFTRATKCMHLISAIPTKKFLAAIPGGYADSSRYANYSQVLYQYCRPGGESDASGERKVLSSGSDGAFDKIYGEMYDFSRMPEEDRKKKSGGEDFPSEYCCYDSSDRLTGISSAGEFFDELAGEEESARQNGIVLHDILSRVNRSEDLRAAVNEAELDGLLTVQEGEDAFKLLSSRIAAHPEFFPEKAAIFNEQDIITENGDSLRPDRVLDEGGRITVIDYKFGKENPAYRRQVLGYMDLFRKMGYAQVSGRIWYVYQDKVDIIPDN